MSKHWTHRLKITRRRFLQGVAGAGGISLATGLYTWRIEPHWLQIVERPMPVAKLPPTLEGATLAQLSDLHIGPRVDDDYLFSVFARVRSLAPDIVVYTGDFISYETHIIEHTRRMFAELPLGARATFAILGNHDYGRGWTSPEIADEITGLARGRNVQMLRNGIGEVDGLQVIGLDDLWAGRFDIQKAMAEFDPARAAIALTHNPDTVDLAGWENFRGWILAGHTHGGQCKAPFLPPPLLPVKNRRYTSGEFDLAGNRKLYINRGVGHLLRVRINARPEVTLFQLARV
jgi:predicted MPP superfamily phosphohydrolase